VTEDQARVGPRLLAFAGLWFLLSGLLMALSFVVVALVAFAGLLLAMLVIGSRWLLERYPLGDAVVSLLVSASRAGGRVGLRLRALGMRRHFQRLAERARATAARVPARVEALALAGLRRYAAAVHRLKLGVSPVLLRATGRLPQLTGRREALQLNELGTQLRRRGQPELAAERHRVALEIVRSLGDEQAEALTLNSLALALAHAGAEAQAVRYLEHARLVLRELGDQEHEGQVIANLGLVYRRQGQSEEAALLLQEALDRLPPESSAYRQIKNELRRAS
jgi:tetratricopeptide (TPR) repeat protein